VRSKFRPSGPTPSTRLSRPSPSPAPTSKRRGSAFTPCPRSWSSNCTMRSAPPCGSSSSRSRSPARRERAPAWRS